MTRRHGIIFLAALVLGLPTGCGSSKKDLQHARTSVYDTDFANVYNAALQATRDLYPLLQDNPGPGRISTGWHQISYGNNQDDLQNQRTLAQSQGMGNTPGSSQQSGMPTRLAYKRYFIRMDVSVIGGRPWRVKVVGHASEWDPGAALPTEMTGAQRPSWLDSRVESLQIAIYKRMRRFAVPMKEEVIIPIEARLPRTDPGSFKNVPPAAAKALASIKDSIGKRDYAALRPLLDEQVVWSLGGGTGADIAIATWQADPTILESMQATIVAGCAGADNKVACPAGTVPAGQYQLVVEDNGAGWKITSFVRAE